MTHFKTPQDGNDMMPYFFGPRPENDKISGWYKDVTMIVIPYITDEKILKSIIPEKFALLNDPIVTITYACNKDIDWLAGRSYNLVSISIKVKFEGKVDKEEGTLNLVMWENLTDPILTGRELQGIPKIYADIKDHQISDETISTSMSHYDNTILDISISNMTQLDDKMVAVISESERNLRSFGIRYLSNVDIMKPPVLNESILHTSQNFFKEIHIGKGSLNWYPSSWEKNPTQAHIINKLQDLPILEYKDSYFIKGATNLFVPDKPSLVLK